MKFNWIFLHPCSSSRTKFGKLPICFVFFSFFKLVFPKNDGLNSFTKVSVDKLLLVEIFKMKIPWISSVRCVFDSQNVQKKLEDARLFPIWKTVFLQKYWLISSLKVSISIFLLLVEKLVANSTISFQAVESWWNTDTWTWQ